MMAEKENHGCLSLRTWGNNIFEYGCNVLEHKSNSRMKEDKGFISHKELFKPLVLRWNKRVFICFTCHHHQNNKYKPFHVVIIVNNKAVACHQSINFNDKYNILTACWFGCSPSNQATKLNQSHLYTTACILLPNLLWDYFWFYTYLTSKESKTKWDLKNHWSVSTELQQMHDPKKFQTL